METDGTDAALEALEDGLVFEPDILQRTQWDGLYQAGINIPAQRPEHRLYLAVLEDAIHAVFTARMDQLVDLRRWLVHPERRDVRINLRSICDVLKLDCAAVQEKLLPHVRRKMGEKGEVDDEEANGDAVPLLGLVRKRIRCTGG